MAARPDVEFFVTIAQPLPLVKLLTLFSVFMLALSSALPAQGAGKKLLLFAMLTLDTKVELEDGAKWMMDKGDAFPVVMYKEAGTKLVLQLAGQISHPGGECARARRERGDR